MEKNVFKLLELKLRQSQGTEFQVFFGAFMTALYPQDYVRIRSVGPHGDDGMDGFLKSIGRVHQCYGSLNGSVSYLNTLCKKIEEDFDTAVNEIGYMKEWCFTHNIVVGMPKAVLDTLEGIERKASNLGIKSSMFGPGHFQELIPRMPAVHRTELLGAEASTGPVLDATVLQPDTAPTFRRFASDFKAEALLDMLGKGLWEILVETLVCPHKLERWSDAARDMCNRIYRYPVISAVDIEKYTYEYDRFAKFFKNMAPHKFDYWLEDISSYFVPQLVISNVGDDVDIGVEVTVTCQNERRVMGVPELHDLSSVRENLALGLSYPRPNHVEFDASPMKVDYVMDAHRDNVVRDTSSSRKYVFETVGAYKEVMVPLCVKIGSKTSKLHIEILSRKTGQKINLDVACNHQELPMSEDDVIDLIERSFVLMPPEQAHIMRQVVAFARTLILRRPFLELVEEVEQKRAARNGPSNVVAVAT
jgi:hypothetical protein